MNYEKVDFTSQERLDKSVYKSGWNPESQDFSEFIFRGWIINSDVEEDNNAIIKTTEQEFIIPYGNLRGAEIKEEGDGYVIISKGSLIKVDGKKKMAEIKRV